MSFFIRYLAAAAVLIAFSANAQPASIDTVRVGACPVLTYGAFFRLISPDTDPPEIERIDGFRNEWGREYSVVVEKKQRLPPLADERATSISLVEVLSARSVEPSRKCTLRLEPHVYLGPGADVPAIEQRDDSTFLYLNDVYLLVPAAHRPGFERVYRKGESRVGIFDFSGRLNALKLIGFTEP